MGAIFLIGAAFALFFAVLLSSKKTKNLPDQVLSAWFLVVMLHLLGYYTDYEKAHLEYPHLLGLHDSFAFLYGPLFFIYADTLTARKPTFKKSYSLHFILFVFSNLLYLPFFLADGSQKVEIYFTQGVNMSPFFMKVLITLKLLSGPVYIIWMWILIRKHRENIQQYFSYTEKIDLKWIKYVTVAFGAFFMVIYVSLSSEKIFPINSSAVIFTAATGLVIALGFGGLKQKVIFSEIHLPATEQPQSGAYSTSLPNGKEIRPGKYEKSGLKEEDGKKYLEILISYMEAEKPYLDSELTIEEVSRRIDIPRHTLTQIINQKLGKNFYQFVNEYRVQETKHRILDPENANFTLLAIGFDSGFNSKSTFNTIFKNLTDMTPSEYRKLNSQP